MQISKRVTAFDEIEASAVNQICITIFIKINKLECYTYSAILASLRNSPGGGGLRSLAFTHIMFCHRYRCMPQLCLSLTDIPSQIGLVNRHLGSRLGLANHQCPIDDVTLIHRDHIGHTLPRQVGKIHCTSQTLISGIVNSPIRRIVHVHITATLLVTADASTRIGKVRDPLAARPIPEL